MRPPRSGTPDGPAAMADAYLIDGYNLLHALGWFPARVGPHALEKLRGRLLALLAGAHGEAASAVTVVFDARRAPPTLSPVQRHHGLRVLYAVDHPEADDLIEELIDAHSSPKQLAVVSDDRRVRQAAQRRRCRVLRCEAYLELLPRLRPRAPGEPDKPSDVPADEADYWREQFRALDDDPAMRELFRPFDFLGE